MKQTDRIIRHLSDYGSITSAEAMNEYGIFRLASRVHDLRSAGFEIVGETVAAKNRYGEPTHFSRYTIGGI